ncbi:hypothetical protein QOZ80_6BG0483570 [Eleusine coracana subsp. coracana]|nr:hypothetical protein QOZ80_6BG0483570 [Eleusine coracana subsp. coracana]
MSMEGIIPFVCGAFTKRRRARSKMEYERLPYGAAATLSEAERFAGGGGTYRSQSCRFDAVARSPAGELDLWRGSDDRRAPPESAPDDDEPFPPARDGRGVSRSRRFGSMRLFACIGGP